MNQQNESLWADRKLTSGAIRILNKVAESLSIPERQYLSRFQILLYELLSDENQVSEFVSLSEEVTQSILTSSDWSDEITQTPADQWQMTLLRYADRLAIEHSIDASTGTEHLLMASLSLSPATEKFLTDHGVQIDRLTRQLITQDEFSEIEVREEIQIVPVKIGAIDEVRLFRILDASANRCREGLRVIEDFVRFGLDDRILSRSLKSLRHDLTSILIYLGQHRWINCRDTLRDVGTQTSLTSEVRRETSLEVVRANLKRTEESLRTLEEFSKQLSADWSRQLEQIRYRFYTIEKALETNLNSRVRLAEARLYLLVTSDSCRYGLERTVRNTVSAGVDIVQLREKSWPDRKLINVAKQVREWTAAHDTLFIINDRPDIAVAVGADGVHLGQDDLQVHEARQIVGSQMLIGVSTHTLAQARDAVFDGADYLGVGPTFSSQTKDFNHFPGLEFVAEMARETSLPWFAIGGIDERRLSQVVDAGGRRVAVSNAICGAPHPRGAAREMAEILAAAPPISTHL